MMLFCFHCNTSGCSCEKRDIGYGKCLTCKDETICYRCTCAKKELAQIEGVKSDVAVSGV